MQAGHGACCSAQHKPRIPSLLQPQSEPDREGSEVFKVDIRNVYFSDFRAFKKAIDAIVSSTHTKYKAEMDSLIGERVQLYDDFVQFTENAFGKPVTSKVSEKADLAG